MGKIRPEGAGEVQEMIDICDFAVGLSRQLYGVTTHSERPGHRMYEQWHPLGVVGVITAFNFPTAVWSWNAAMAAVCGDAVVWKPASAVPLCAIAVQHICNRVAADYGLRGVFNLLVGAGAEVGERLLNDPRVPLVSFTGSVAMGRHVAATVAAPAGPHHPGAGRQQRHRRHGRRRPGAGDARHPVRRRGHRRPALHHHPPHHRAARHRRRARRRLKRAYDQVASATRWTRAC